MRSQDAAALRAGAVADAQAVDHEHVARTERGQVEGDRTADDTGADDDHVMRLLHA
jgi:hypothetical protein